MPYPHKIGQDSILFLNSRASAKLYTTSEGGQKNVSSCCLFEVQYSRLTIFRKKSLQWVFQCHEARAYACTGVGRDVRSLNLIYMESCFRLLLRCLTRTHVNTCPRFFMFFLRRPTRRKIPCLFR